VTERSQFRHQTIYKAQLLFEKKSKTGILIRRDEKSDFLAMLEISPNMIKMWNANSEICPRRMGKGLMGFANSQRRCRMDQKSKRMDPVSTSQTDERSPKKIGFEA
jgi:hypothetical protein